MIIVEGPDGSGKTELITRLGYDRHSLKSLRGGVGASSASPNGWAQGGNEEPPLYEYVCKVIAGELEEDSTKARIAYDRFHLTRESTAPSCGRSSWSMTGASTC
jgi:hypothetical protein